MSSLKDINKWGFREPVMIMAQDDYADLLRFVGVPEDEVQRRLAILNEEPTQEIEVGEDET